MNSGNQRGAGRVIRNGIDVAPNEEMFERSLSVMTERNQIDLQSPFRGRREADRDEDALLQRLLRFDLRYLSPGHNLIIDSCNNEARTSYADN
jgi:hypothetical protein